MPRSLGLVVLALAIPASAAVTPATRCLDAKLGATARLARAELACRALAAKRARSPSSACLSRATVAFGAAFAKAEKRGGCITTNDTTDVTRLGEALARRAAAGLVPDPATRSTCGARQLIAGGRRVVREAHAHGRNVRRGDLAKLVAAFGVANAKFSADIASAERLGDCQATGEELARGLFDSGLDAVYGFLGVVGFGAGSFASGAEPAKTPGSVGIYASAYPKLVTEYGGAFVDLNRATYTRFFYHPAYEPPDAILILVPGFEGGAMSFKILAENLVSRAAETGLAIEVWAFDRRGNQLEDRDGIAIAKAARDADVGLDWMFGQELGLPLSPVLTRRAVFHDVHADTAFMANWTNLVFSRDIDALVEAAGHVAKNANVFLGGHSAGTGFTARYAATDFDLTGAGPAQPGFAKLRGLVLLEGGGGATGTAPVTEDALDRMEDKADGGLFFAVRDDAPRCVDGTACTVASEATDCAGKGHGTCTEAAAAYAVVPGLLNPRILASAEPGAVQGLDDPDTGRVILQVDQGSAGNSAIAKVPDLAALAILPAATAEGALGTFVDDDGLVSSFATFVRTSVGGPGPVVGGLLTWQDVTEGPFAASLLPNNGPPPTALPGAVWGQEKEVTRIDRMGLTFITPDSNFTDWYYPAAGPSTTAGFDLDSIQLSVGRGRRDIENLTQAGAIDIPVIAFGGTNGLTPVPGVYTRFAQSIGLCAAPGCDGTPRVVDASAPNPAFPTFGGVAGGFEVHLSEGYAHIDIVTAEDDADNAVIGPLVDFLARNRR